jgi:hypothetical protein
MITNVGKNIIAKYLLGQAPAYASYIAIGCGAKPLSPDAPFDSYLDKTELDFEMFRVPIISRGFVNEDGVSKVVLTGELPTEERYEISEVGIYSAGSNPAAAVNDSKLLYAFTQNENWEYHTQTSVESIPVIYEPLDGGAQDNVINVTEKVFQTNVDNRIFTNSSRLSKYEKCRFFNNVIVMSGDVSDIILDEENKLIPNPESTSDHIHLTGVDIDLNKNSPLDEIRFAFSVISKDGSSIESPDSIRLILEFSSTDVVDQGEFARFEVNLDSLVDYNFANNRYFVISKKLEELTTSNGFTWNSVDVVKIYASVVVDDAPSEDYYVCIDAVRVENLSTSSPLYGLTGYTVIKNANAETIIKQSNTSNLVEFRFAIDIVDIEGES